MRTPIAAALAALLFLASPAARAQQPAPTWPPPNWSWPGAAPAEPSPAVAQPAPSSPAPSAQPYPAPAYYRPPRAKKESRWRELGIGPRVSSVFNFSSQLFGVGGGIVMLLNLGGDALPLEVEFEVGYDRYFGADKDKYELYYGGTFHFMLSTKRLAPYLMFSGGRSLSEDGDASDARWYFGGGLGLSYRTKQFFLSASARVVAMLGGPSTTLPVRTEGVVEIRLLGMGYAW
jgi:hypothetical protein